MRMAVSGWHRQKQEYRTVRLRHARSVLGLGSNILDMVYGVLGGLVDIWGTVRSSRRRFPQEVLNNGRMVLGVVRNQYWCRHCFYISPENIINAAEELDNIIE